LRSALDGAESEQRIAADVSMSDERGHRIAMNESVFREVNERIEDLAETFELGDQPLNLVCECGDPTCVQRITIKRSEYEAVRSDPTLFVVHPGHEIPDVEEMVEERDGYDVIRKGEGEPAKVAEETDPRN
jgi:hypothetical protein